MEKALKSVEDETGLKPEQIETITFHYPKLPMGPGDESQFCLQVTTKKPYAKNTVLAGFRPSGEKPVGEIVKLREKMLLHLTSDTQFTVLHETLLDEFKKGKSATTDGVMADALRAARRAHTRWSSGLTPADCPPRSSRLPRRNCSRSYPCSSQSRSCSGPTSTRS